jgi:organic radical activating enzyme
MKITKIKNFSTDCLSVEFVLGNVCNYKCHYCFPGCNEGTHRWPDYDLVLKNMQTLFEFYQAQGKKKIDLKIIGGETTLWPKLSSFVKSIKQTADVFVRISTNASRTLSYWNDKTELFDEITISVHNEFADLDHIIKVADLIYSKRQSNLYVFVLMDPFNWDKSVKCLDYLMANSEEWFLSPQPVLFNNVTVYDDEQKAYLQTVTKRECKDFKRLDPNYTMVFYEDASIERYDYKKIVLNNLNNFYGYSCNLGIDRLYINIQGNVRGACGETLFGGDLNIKDLDFAQKLRSYNEIKPVICKQHTCGCGAEIILDKEIL